MEIEQFDDGLFDELDSPEGVLLDGSEVSFELWDEIWDDFRASRAPFPN